MNFREQLTEAFPASSDALLVHFVRQGILLAANTMENEPCLKSLIGRDLAGHVRRAAVLFTVHSACVAGNLPFESTMTKMPLGGGHWVELKTKNFRAHICRTDKADAFPEDTPTRQDQRISNQLELSFPSSSVVVPFQKKSTPIEMYAWLTFGAEGGELSHLCWGMPESRRNVWIERINIMQRLRQAGTQPVSAEPTVSKKIELKFHQHIEDALRKDEDPSKRSP